VTLPLTQHQEEIEQNLRAWEGKPLLKEVYAAFSRRIVALIDSAVPGRVVEVGSGIGNLKAFIPGALATDLFPNPWLDLVCDTYELPFRQGSLSHLVLFDVFHHLRAPDAFLHEARRVLAPGRGRLILLEPYIGWTTYPIYGLFHHEPVALKEPISRAVSLPRPRDYYAAEGNATRLFFWKELPGWPEGWEVFHAEAFSCFHYFLTGGYAKPALYPAGWLKAFQKLDAGLSRWPKMFAGRCLIGLRPQ
jgi:SAM-dependent methyltransferase